MNTNKSTYDIWSWPRSSTVHTP